MEFLISIKNFFMKFVYRIFGSTKIFVVILGWFLILTGIWMLLRPERARRKFARQSFRYFKFYLLFVALFLGAILVSISARVSGILSLAVLCAGIFFLIKGYFVFKKKAAQKINGWAKTLSVRTLRVYAVVQIAIGVLMLVLQRRVWY